MHTILQISFLSLILLLTQNCLAQSDFWQQTGELIGSSDGITDILCTSDGIVYVTTSDSGINKSTDNGNSWTLISPWIARTICNNADGDLLIAKDSILMSTDNGNTWVTVNNSAGNMSVLHLNPSGDIFAGGNTIIRSTDGGFNWQSTAGFMGIGVSMAVDSSGVIYIGNYSLGIHRSTDDGLNWSQTTLSLGDVLDLAVHPGNNVYTASNFGVYKSTNNGLNWNSVGFTGVFRAITVTTDGDIYLAGEHNFVTGVYKSTDEGNTWSELNSGLVLKKDSVISKFAISREGYIYACASSGKVFRSAQPVAGVPAYDELPERHSLAQNYPNPFNPTTMVSFVICHASLVSLKIVDVMGREVAVLVNENKQPGEYNIRWDAEGMPSGVYLCRLIAGDFMQTNKMILIR